MSSFKRKNGGFMAKGQRGLRTLRLSITQQSSSDASHLTHVQLSFQRMSLAIIAIIAIVAPRHCRVTSCGVVTITAPSILASLRYVTMDKCLDAAFWGTMGGKGPPLANCGLSKGVTKRMCKAPLLNWLSIQIK